ncbi:MAG: hypothetical protein ACRDZ4_21205 [Egibacteraceae bacterium]
MSGPDSRASQPWYRTQWRSCCVLSLSECAADVRIATEDVELTEMTVRTARW